MNIVYECGCSISKLHLPHVRQVHSPSASSMARRKGLLVLTLKRHLAKKVIGSRFSKHHLTRRVHHTDYGAYTCCFKFPFRKKNPFPLQYSIFYACVELSQKSKLFLPFTVPPCPDVNHQKTSMFSSRKPSFEQWLLLFVIGFDWTMRFTML